MSIQASERFEVKLSADQQAELIRRAKQLGVTRGALVRELLLQPAPSEVGPSSGGQEQLTALAEQLQELLTLARAAALLAPQDQQGQIGKGSVGRGSVSQGSRGLRLSMRARSKATAAFRVHRRVRRHWLPRLPVFRRPWPALWTLPSFIPWPAPLAMPPRRSTRH